MLLETILVILFTAILFSVLVNFIPADRKDTLSQRR